MPVVTLMKRPPPCLAIWGISRRMNMSGALKLQSIAVLIASHSRSSIFSQFAGPS